MNRKKSRLLKTALFVALLSAALYAAIDFNPATMPTVTIAPYALKDADLSVADNHAYRPWFENGAWQGDLIEYDLATDSTRTTDASVGSNPPVASGNNWMARATFAAKENPSGDGVTFNTYWQESVNGRQIFTVGATGDQAAFLWNNLSDAQKTALDPVTFALGTNGAYDSPILNYVRGDRSNEKGQGGSYRDRYSLLGDIVNSYPVYIGPSKETFTIPGYPTFRDSVKTRDGRIAVGANDGMLHVFDEDDGSEVYAYLPSMLFDKLDALKAVPYKHTYYVDGQITVGSAKNGASWMSVLTGTLGAGAKGLYGLNVTDPDMSTDKVLFEKTGADIGYILGRPRIGRKTDGKWYIFTGNGLNSSNGVAKLLMFELDGLTYTQTELSTGVAGGLSAPVLVDANKDFKTDYAFAGDSNGDMWKFYLGSSPPLTNPVKIFDGSPDRPILTAPAVAAHPSSGFMVIWATGSSLSLAEATDTSYPSQAVYGVWDQAIGDAMVTQVMLEEADADFSGNTETVRYIDSNNAVNYTCAANDATCTKGWVVVLPNSGERALGPVQVRAGRIALMTSTPLGTPASSDLIGNSWLLSLSYYSGGDGDEVAFNLNGDNDKNDLDKVDVSAGGDPDLRVPVGLNLGDGNISQPVLARLTGGTDVMYINGLRLPLSIIPPDIGPFLTGHIDVHTDSPNSNPKPGGSIAANSRNKHSERYNIDASDGLGRGVDGHFHEYDTVNNVHYVDLFELEPRRGQPNAAAVLSSTPCDTTTDNEKEVLVGGQCLQAVEGELNRAYDTLQTDVDGNPDAKESEVNEYTQSTPLPKDDKFIVVVANGDLTPAGKLQIGCRTWDVVDYENMLASQLEAGTAPQDLDDTVNGITAAGTLVFTLEEIENGSADTATCPDDSPNPTLRVSFTTRDILDGGIHGTRSQCVLGLHDYRDPVDYWDDEVLCHAPKHLYGKSVSCSGITDPGAANIKDPADNLHVTEVAINAHTGFRWRNGALTLQLLKVNNFTNAAEYTLQHPDFLPTDNRGNRYGGTYAQAFTGTKKSGGDSYPNPLAKGANESGLLYENSMYWHFGDLADEIQRGAPASIPCYGDPSWGSAFTQETRGLTYGQYKKLYEDIAPDLLALYDDAVLALEAALAGGDEASITDALLTLANLLTDEDLAYYDRFRDYAPGNIPEQHLRDIDKDRVPPADGGGGGTSTDDGIPVDVVDLEDLDTETVGPNFMAGRRTWTDLRM